MNTAYEDALRSPEKLNLHQKNRITLAACILRYQHEWLPGIVGLSGTAGKLPVPTVLRIALQDYDGESFMKAIQQTQLIL